ncbi:DNA polymerase I [Clostridium polynesiense]|uniref:DNA polymerase I n=1 Tax=Clostridium polynesiense TaxID=1325933 RepID=UPI0005905C56|nr:DNA polymerase I [Clostridium polynesiense]
MEKLLLLDSNSIMNRAFYALPPLTNAEGLHTNAVYGFVNMLFKMYEEIKPDYVVAAFDRKAPTFRHTEYAEYKAGRKKMPPELAEQFPVIKELLDLMAINIFEIDGYEADDLIGTLSTYAEKNSMEVYILTGDKDALQLATDRVKVIITKKGVSEKEIYDKDRMVMDMGVTPKQFIDVKGLMGDASDNIPGVPGIGEKTAFKLIQTYGSIENLLMNLDSVSGKRVKENLLQYSEQAIFSKKLATIITEVPVEIDLNEIKSKDKFDKESLRKLFFRLQFKSLVDKIPGDNLQEETVLKVNSNKEIEIIRVSDSESVNSFLKSLDIKEATFLNFDISHKEFYTKTEIHEIYVTYKDKVYVLEIDEIIKDSSSREGIKAYLENEGYKKVCYDAKNAFTALNKADIKLKGVIFDVMVAAYLIDSSKGQYPLMTLINEYLGEDPQGDEEELMALQNYYLPKLYHMMSQKIIDDKMEKLYYEVELPLTEVLSSMEVLGFKVNRSKLEELGDKFKLEIESTQKEIYSIAEEEFNINSPKQLGKILFEKLDLPVIKKTKTGYSTNAEVLEQLADKHPIINKITYYRQLTKLNSTYIEGLKNVIDEDGCIHSSFNQTVTSTGRLSSTEPNLQNIPIKYEMGREIRKIFTPFDDESMILSADYSQIELRVLADIASDLNMISAFKDNIDIHTKTASEVFKVPLDEVTKLMRGRAKAVNFGIVYGISDFSLAKDLKITKKEAKEYIDIYFERYPSIKEYLNNIVVDAKEKGYVTTLLNRRRFIPEINASNKMVKALGERLAMNAPIQGSAADIIKLAMVRVYQELTKNNLKSKLILQVHDELILNVYKDELDKVKEIVKKAMEQVLELKVPLEIDMNLGKDWYDAK